MTDFVRMHRWTVVSAVLRPVAKTGDGSERANAGARARSEGAHAGARAAGEYALTAARTLRLLLTVMTVMTVLTWSLAIASGCTAFVVHDATNGPQCDDDDDCGAGTVCVDTVCVAIDDDPTPGVGTPIDADGGVVVGPDGLALDIPAGALTGTVHIRLERVTATLPRDNFDADAFYRVQPALTLTVPGTLTLPGEGEALFLRPSAGATLWDEIAPEDTDRFEVSTLDVFARGDAVEAP